MIRIELTDVDAGRVRVGFHPSWELAGALGVLGRYGRQAPPPWREWAGSVHRSLDAPLRERLAPAHASAVALARSLAVPTGEPPPAAPGPRASLGEAWLPNGRPHELLHTFWAHLLRPYWTPLRAHLQDECARLAARADTGGTPGLLDALGARVSWSSPWLLVPYHQEVRLTLRSADLVVVPTAFFAGRRLVTRSADGTVAVSVHAQAAEAVLSAHPAPSDPDQDDRLCALLGAGRAAVLRSLRAPSTTNQVADALGLAKSTVSQHLTVLVRTGAVQKERSGAFVYYSLGRRGYALLQDFG